MVTLTNNNSEGDIMAVEDIPSLSPRKNCPLARQRMREERKRTIKLLEEKYATFDDHERNPRRFVLIRNNLRRLQREAREEKLARHRSLSDFSPLRSSFTDEIAPPLTPFPDDEPPCKRLRPFDNEDDDKENEHRTDVEMKDDLSISGNNNYNVMDDAQEILRDLYEACTPEVISPRPLSPASQKTTDTSSSSTSSSLSFSMSTSFSSMSNNSYSASSDNDWNWQSPYHYPCGHSSSMRGNDLKSVVFHSLIASLES